MSQISLQDYADLGSGSVLAGNYSQQDVEQLYKAMSAGQITGRETTDSLAASGAGLKVESLENTLKILVNTPKHTPFYYRIAKKPATNTVEEYNQLVSYGDLDGGFTLEGELPESADSIYRRKAQLIKYMGVVGGVTHPMQLVQTGSGVANMIAQETKNKVEFMTKLIEGYLPFANSAIVPEHFDGFFAQHYKENFSNLETYHDSELVVDLRGSVLTDTAVENASLGVVNNYGLADMLISSPRTFSNYVTKYHSKKLINPVPQQVRDGVFGQRVKEIITQNGDVEIMQSNFFRFSTMKTTATGATSTKAPAAPVADISTPIALVSDTQNRWTNFTGDYFYAVSAKNKYGESALTPLTASALFSVTATNSVVLKFAAGTGVAQAATGFCIYRSKKNPTGVLASTPLYKIFEISAAELAAGYDGSSDAGLVRDRNRYLPDTDQAMLIEWDADQVLAWKQLAPMMKMNLAITAPIQKFMVLCYGTPILYAPGKMVRFINIGNEVGSN